MKLSSVTKSGLARAKHAVIAGLFVGTYALSASMPFMAATANAANEPAGNNGTIKINDVIADNGQGNDPMLESCTLNIKWYGFDMGNRASTVSFEAQNPTDESQLLTPIGVQNERFTGTGTGGTELAHEKDYTMSFTGAPQGQGYHVKVTVATDGSQGNDTKSKVFWLPETCQASVAAATVVTADPCGVANDTYTIPATSHVTYSVNGVVKPADTYSTEGALSLTVTAAAEEGYVLGGEASQTLTFTNAECEVVAACTVSNNTYSAPWMFNEYTNPDAGAYPSGTAGTFRFTAEGLVIDTSAEESYVSGLIDAGATRLQDIDTMSYKTYRDPSSIGLSYQAAAYVLYVDVDGNLETTDDQNYLLFEPLYTYGNDAIQPGVWQTWDVLHEGTSKWWGFFGGDPSKTWNDILAEYPNAVALAYGFNQGTSNSGIINTVQDIVFDCATTHFVAPTTGGQGGGEVLSDTAPVTPVAAPKVVAAVPKVLEDTGTNVQLTMLFSTGVLVLTLAAFVQNTVLGAKIINRARQFMTQPFVVPTA